MRPYLLAEMLAERVGFEPTCPLRDKTLSRRPRYDHFGTSPLRSIGAKRTFNYRSWARPLGPVADGATPSASRPAPGIGVASRNAQVSPPQHITRRPSTRKTVTWRVS